MGRGRSHCRFCDGPSAGRTGSSTGTRRFRRRRRRPSVDVEVHSDIPLRGGLGSSAAATIAGLRLGN